MKPGALWVSGVLALGLWTACGNGKLLNPAFFSGTGMQARHPAGESHADHGHGDHHSGHGEPESPDDHGSQDHGGIQDGPDSGGHPSSSHGEHGGHEADTGELEAAFSFPGGSARAGATQPLTIRIRDGQGVPVQRFSIRHEERMHLMIVSRDLSFFRHVHPVYQGDGVFEVEAAFPTGGAYKLIADFAPEGGAPAVLSHWVKVEGAAASPVPLRANSRLVAETDGKRIELILGGGKPKRETALTYRIADAQTGRGIDDLEPYLGEVGHVVALSADAERYLHVHPVQGKATGPEARFAVVFPEAGLYKLWGQFKHRGEVFTVPLVVEIR
jgi:hypothetical protein